MGLTLIPMFTLGTVCGSILLAGSYRGSGRSVFLVALWHANYNLVSGTAAAADVGAAVVSTGLMVWAAAIVITEIRGSRRRPS
jgi:hypothetical protein